MRNRSYFYILIIAIMVLAASCSGGGNPVSPDVESEQQYRSPLVGEAPTAEDSEGHVPMFLGTMTFDLVNNSVEMTENHSALAHYNVRPMLENPFTCPNLNCISVLLTGYDPEEHIYTVDVSLRNPSNFVAYDARGIMFLNPNKDTTLLNPDNYIMLYDPLEQINPFKAFAKSAPDRQFVPAGIYTESYQVYIPPPPPLFNINYAIDVSWPSNCREPYWMKDIEYNGNLTPSGGNGTISCKVEDHQDDIDTVMVDLHAFTGSVEELEYDSVDDIWTIDFSNDAGMPEGEYECLMSTKSVNYNLALYDYVSVTVVAGGEQYLTGKIFDTYTMDPLDGAEISVVNQDISGFSPPINFTTAGDYEIQLEPGTYDMSISTVGYDIMTCNGIIIPAGETYEADFGLNTTGAPNQNPYPYTGCINGKITDAGTGNPIPEAAVRVRSDALNEFDIPKPKFSSGAAANENGYYSVTEIMVSSDQYSFYPVADWEVECSAPGYEAVVLTTTMIEHNIATPNVHFELNPIEPGKTVVFAEDFESPSDWTFEFFEDEFGYATELNLWNILLWDSSIVNICVTEGWVYEAPNEGDGGIVPEPPVSEYNPGPNTSYLWYGDPGSGSFIGYYDPFNQSPGGGGDSDIENGGLAISPGIDLSAYTNGYLAFESAWEIESQNSSNFDFMEVFIRDDTGTDYALDFLNPAIDPYMTADPISNGGHNRDAIWNHLVYDITPYMNNSDAHIVYRFYTSDSLYNGFKGWFIDNVKVYGY